MGFLLRARQSWWKVAKRIVQKANADDCPDLAAKMSYYFVLALFPFLIVLAAIVGFLPFTGLWDHIVAWMILYMPAEIRKSLLLTILDLTRGRSAFLSFGIIGTTWAASSGVVSLMESLSLAYGVRETRSFWKKHVIALLMLWVVAAFFIGSFALMSAGHWIGTQIARLTDAGRLFIVTWEFSRWLVSIVLVTLAIQLIDFALPNVRRKWRWISPGGGLAVVCLIGLSLGFNSYVRHFSLYGKTYDALLVFIVLTVWIYLVSFILLLAAETNCVLEEFRASGMAA